MYFLSVLTISIPVIFLYSFKIFSRYSSSKFLEKLIFSKLKICCKFEIISGKNSFFSSISPLFTVATMITLIFARITMHQSRKIEILFNVFMTLMLLGIFLVVVFTITCMNTMNNCY